MAYHFTDHQKQLARRIVDAIRSSELNEAVSSSKLSSIDTRNTERIPLSGKKVELVTEHPAGSYEIVKEQDELAYLKIKDPDAFWRLSHYLVAEVR